MAQLAAALRYKPEGRGFDSRWWHWNFSLTQSFWPHYGPGLTQPLTEMSTRNIFWGVKATGALGWQPYHLHVPIVLKSGSLNLLEPSGSVQVSNGIACYILHTALCEQLAWEESMDLSIRQIVEWIWKQLRWIEFLIVLPAWSLICATDLQSEHFAASQRYLCLSL